VTGEAGQPEGSAHFVTAEAHLMWRFHALPSAALNPDLNLRQAAFIVKYMQLYMQLPSCRMNNACRMIGNETIIA
jgi:hypothetical protein